MQRLRMLGFVHRVQHLERELKNFSDFERFIWLQLINSDILSAVEKKSPVIRIVPEEGSGLHFDFKITRSERGFEGEDFLHILEKGKNGDGKIVRYLENSEEPHLIKLKERINYLRRLKALVKG
jgi:hypothetical protein